MTTDNGNKGAFPETKTSHKYGNTNNERWDYGDTYSTGGLTKREYFAALAMQGILANASVADAVMFDKTIKICQGAVEHADMLLKQLENKKV